MNAHTERENNISMKWYKKIEAFAISKGNQALHTDVAQEPDCEESYVESIA